jgi:sarcosine oxidase subunit beta
VRRWDCVVVGAGIVGCGVAWRLAQAGRSVVVVDARDVGSGASGGVGLRGVRANCRHFAELALAARATELWPDLANMLGAPTGYVRTGHLQLSEQPRPVGWDEITGRQNRIGIRTEVLSAPRLRDLEPDLSEQVCAALWCPDDGVADHSATTAATAHAARGVGADVRIGSAVTHVASHGSHVTVATSHGDQLIAASCVVAAGPATATLLAPFEPTPPVFAVYPQVVVTEPPPRRVVRHLIGHAERPLAVKTLPDDSLMLTGGRLGIHDPARGHGIVHPVQIQANLDDAAAVFPALRNVSARLTVADRPEAVTADLLPIIDRVPDQPLWFATGWSGHGWAIAPAVSEALASWIITDTRPPSLDLLHQRR